MGWTAPIFQRFAQNAGDHAKAAQYTFNAKSERIAADRDSAARLEDLNDTLSNIKAIRTARGLDVASPTGMAISEGFTKRAETGIATSRPNYMTKAQNDMFQAWGAQAAANKMPRYMVVPLVLAATGLSQTAN